MLYPLSLCTHDCTALISIISKIEKGAEKEKKERGIGNERERKLERANMYLKNRQKEREFYESQ